MNRTLLALLDILPAVLMGLAFLVAGGLILYRLFRPAGPLGRPLAALLAWTVASLTIMGFFLHTTLQLGSHSDHDVTRRIGLLLATLGYALIVAATTWWVAARRSPRSSPTRPL